jgi:hypothetical protein
MARFARRHVRELGGDGLPEQHRTGPARERNARRVPVRPMSLVDGRAVLGRHVAGIDDVLHAEGHAVKQSAPAASVERACLRERCVRVKVVPGLNLRLARCDAVETRAHHRLAGGAARADRSDDLGCSQFIQRPHRLRTPIVKPALSAQRNAACISTPVTMDDFPLRITA